YRAGTAIAGRAVGLSFAALLMTAPAYLRFAAIARAYAMVVFSLCLILAMVARTKHLASRGEWVGVASLVGLWTSYLLCPLALAAPWIARLGRRDRIRLTAALALMAVALVPRVINGFAVTRGGMFEIPGPVAAFGYALSIAGQAAPPGYFSPEEWIWL